MERRFAVAVLLVSGLAALALALLLGGVHQGEPALAVGGGLLGAVALAGVIALARVVAINERTRRRR